MQGIRFLVLKTLHRGGSGWYWGLKRLMWNSFSISGSCTAQIFSEFVSFMARTLVCYVDCIHTLESDSRTFSMLNYLCKARRFVLNQ